MVNHLTQVFLLMAISFWITNTNAVCNESLHTDVEAVFGEQLTLNCNAPPNCSEIFWTATRENVILDKNVGPCNTEIGICYNGTDGDDNLYISRVSEDTIGYAKCRCSGSMGRYKLTACFNVIGICRAEVEVGNNPSLSYYSSGAMNDTVAYLVLDEEETVTVRCQESAMISNNCSDPNEINPGKSSPLHTIHPRHPCAVICTVADHCQITLVIHVNETTTRTAPTTSITVSSTEIIASHSSLSSTDVSASFKATNPATTKSEVIDVKPKIPKSVRPTFSTRTSMSDLLPTTDETVTHLSSYNQLVIYLAAISATSVLMAACACCYYFVTTRRHVRKDAVGSSEENDFSSEMPSLDNPGGSHVIQLNEYAAYSELNDSREKILGDEKDPIKITKKRRNSEEDASVATNDVKGGDREDASREVGASNKDENDVDDDDEDYSIVGNGKRTTGVDSDVSPVIYATVDKTKNKNEI